MRARRRRRSPLVHAAHPQEDFCDHGVGQKKVRSLKLHRRSTNGVVVVVVVGLVQSPFGRRVNVATRPERRAHTERPSRFSPYRELKLSQRHVLVFLFSFLDSRKKKLKKGSVERFSTEASWGVQTKEEEKGKLGYTICSHCRRSLRRLTGQRGVDGGEEGEGEENNGQIRK